MDLYTIDRSLTKWEMEVAGESSRAQTIESSDEESESIFGALNFDPQLFIDDVRNAVDDVVNEGFELFKNQVAKVLGVEDDKMLKELFQCVGSVQYIVQLKLDKQLDIWEKYCLLNCFAIPEGLVLPEMNDTRGSLFGSIFADRILDEKLDIQLESLRETLVSVGRKSAELHRDLCTLERQKAATAQHAEVLNEALQPLEENSTHDVIKEIVRTSSELQNKMELLKIERRDKMENLGPETIRSPDLSHSKGLQARVDDLQQFAANFKGLNEN